ncbi:MAG: 50S ribosomal protein L24 [candidate division Zixibacteria bacterium RBG_16_40_9]|nr:MAG: 50S ribosomal protein L24 [candidate division Zixibacteria bacterium RBG_16_40_9]
MKIRKDDTVMVISGDDKGKTGKVLMVFPDDNKVLVEGINFIKRHTRPTQKNRKGGILEKEAPLNISNVLVYCGKCASSTKIGHKIITQERTGKPAKVRICRRCGEVI